MGAIQGQRWSNWSGSVQCMPQEVIYPESIEKLSEVIRTHSQQGRHMRVVGSGHSFTPLVQTGDILLSLDRLQGIERIDADRKNGGTVTVLGGTNLKRLGDDLLARGLAQENLGDIDVQSISGAISTGTHGTGMRFGTLSTQIEALTLVTATGELLECSPETNADIFKAAQVSLGTLGVIASVKLRVVPAKSMHFQSHSERLSDCLAKLERYKQENEHFEFFWFPYTNEVQAKFINVTTAPASTRNLWNTLWGNFNKVVLENGVYWVLSEGCRLVPRLCQTVSNISAHAVATVDEIDYSHHVFATPRWVRFNEMEYNIPAQHVSTVIEEIRACIDQHQFAVHFPIECRFVHSDDIWLSPAYQRESSYIAVHMYRGMEYKPYFRHVEEIFRRYDGRPHWGKMHTLDARRFAELYPRWHDFRRIRAMLDPQGIFLNEYLSQIFDAEKDIPSQENTSAVKIDTSITGQEG